MACVPFNSRQDKTLNKSDIKLLEKKGEEKKYNNIQKETADFSLLSNMAFNFFLHLFCCLFFRLRAQPRKQNGLQILCLCLNSLNLLFQLGKFL